MSAMSRARKAMGYEKNVPRCSNCQEYQPGGVILTRDSIPKNKPPICKAAGFTVSPLACCDRWHREGEILA